MSKFRSLILIIGLLLIAVAAALLTVLVLYATGTIVTDPIELVYSVGSDKKIYDGTPLTLAEDDYLLESGSVLEGHTAQVKVVGSQTDAGTSQTTVEVKIYDKKGFDVTDEYAVKVNTGTLTVDKKDISVVIHDSDVYYSGKEVYFDDYEVDEELALGHRFVGLNTALFNVGDTIPQDIEFLVYDAFGTAVTDNYNVTYEVGTVKVVARPVTIKPVDVTRYYDGQTFTATEYEITEGSLVVGQSAHVEICTEAGGTPSAKNASETRITVDARTLKIYADDGVTEVTSNYDITRPTAFLKIEKRPISIATGSNTFIYNGTAQSSAGYTIVAGDIAPRQQLQTDGFDSITDVGSITNSFTYKITDADGEEVTGNYEVSTSFGTLTVKPLDITVYTKSYSKEYDGKPLRDAMDGDKCRIVPALPSNLFKINYSVDGAILNQTSAVAQTEYDITDLTIQNTDGEDLIARGNFNINYQSGQYSISKKPITVQSPSATFIYNGVGQSASKDGYKAYGLVGGDELSVNEATLKKVTFVTDSGTNFFEFDILSGAVSVKENYEISYDFGVLTVVKKELEIKSETKSFTYDGQAHSYIDNITPAVADGDKFAIVENSQTTVKDVVAAEPNLFTYTITRGGADVSDNYSIKFTAGILSVTPKSVTITTATDEKVYDKLKLSNGNGTPDGILAGHNLSLDGVAPSITDAGSIHNTLKFKVVSGADDVTANYDISYIYGTLTVTPKPYTIELNKDFKETYEDGKPYIINPTNVFNEGQLNECGVTVADFIINAPEMINAGKYTYTAEFTGTVKNYVPIPDVGKVEIYKKEAKLVWDKNVTISMTYHGAESYYSDDGALIAGLSVDNHPVVSATFAKSLETIEVTHVSLGEEFDGNYEITEYVTIAVTVKKCEITLVLPTFSYDPYFFAGDLEAAIAEGVTVQGLAAGDSFKATVKLDGDEHYKVLNYTLTNSEYYTITNIDASGEIHVIYAAP